MKAKRINAPKSSGRGKPTMIQAAENIGALVARGTRVSGKAFPKAKKKVEKKAAPKKVESTRVEKPIKAEKPTKAPKAPKPPKQDKPKAQKMRKDGLPPAVDLSFDK